MVVKKEEKNSEIHIEPLRLGSATLWIRGVSPFIYNAMSEKARHDLLFPSGRKTTADKATQMKHEPMQEYRNSVYKRVGNGATRLIFPAAGFKGAMAEVATQISGTSKSQINKLVWVEGDKVDMYGIPQMKMDVVRMQDISRTPDVRTRAILTNWACKINIRFSVPTLNETNIVNLIGTAGLLIGVGDFRQGKGKGNYGQFEICPNGEKDVEHIIKLCGIKEQDAALEDPGFYDSETQRLYEWFESERKKRGK